MTNLTFTHQQTLNGYSNSNVISFVEILATPESCESCLKLEGNKYNLKEEISSPNLPNSGCTNLKHGCRCTYIPVVD